MGYKLPAGVQISWRGTYFEVEISRSTNFQEGYKFCEGVQIFMKGTYLGGKNLILQISSKRTYFVGTNSLRGTYKLMKAKGRESKKRPLDESPEFIALQYHKLCMVMVVSDSLKALSYGLNLWFHPWYNYTILSPRIVEVTAPVFVWLG